MRVVTYCVMSNHFHILVEVKPRPEGQEFSDEWVVQQASAIYSKFSVRMLLQTLEDWRKAGNHQLADKLKKQYLGRMWDVSQFMEGTQTTLQSLGYNKRANVKAPCGRNAFAVCWWKESARRWR